MEVSRGFMVVVGAADGEADAVADGDALPLAATVAGREPPGCRATAPPTASTVTAATAPVTVARRRRRIDRPRSAAPATSAPSSGPMPSIARSKVVDSRRPSDSSSSMLLVPSS
ncbi:hypothetical protein EH183_25720 [Streptomyces sp. CB01881]|nr:hypothetical protein EH183_25720 [Streptomyces sp. CB01881]